MTENKKPKSQVGNILFFVCMLALFALGIGSCVSMLRQQQWEEHRPDRQWRITLYDAAGNVVREYEQWGKPSFESRRNICTLANGTSISGTFIVEMLPASEDQND